MADDTRVEISKAGGLPKKVIDILLKELDGKADVKSPREKGELFVRIKIPNPVAPQVEQVIDKVASEAENMVMERSDSSKDKSIKSFLSQGGEWKPCLPARQRSPDPDGFNDPTNYSVTGFRSKFD